MLGRDEEKEEVENQPTLFNQIYEIAKHAKNNNHASQKLSQLLKNNNSIDIRDSDSLLTPAGKLAKEGNKAAWEFLIKSGANINLIAYCAAADGYRDHAEILRLHYGASATDIAAGAAFGGYRGYAEYLRLLHNHNVNVNKIAATAAMGGHFHYAEELRQLKPENQRLIFNRVFATLLYHIYKTFSSDDSMRYSCIAAGAAFSGYREYAENLRLEHSANVNIIALSAAAGANYEYAEFLRLNHHASLKIIAAGAAIRGRTDYVENLRRNFGALDTIAYGAAYGGHINYVEHLRIYYGIKDINKIAFSAALGGHLSYTENLFLNHKAAIQSIAEGANLSKRFINKTIALHSFAFINNDAFKITLAEALCDSDKLSYDIEELVDKTIELRPKYNYRQCIALGKFELVIWFMQCAILIKQKKLHSDIFLSIATYLAPLNYSEAKDLYKNLSFDISKQLSVRDINKFYNSSCTLYFFKGHKKSKSVIGELCSN